MPERGFLPPRISACMTAGGPVISSGDLIEVPHSGTLRAWSAAVGVFEACLANRPICGERGAGGVSCAGPPDQVRVRIGMTAEASDPGSRPS